MKVSKCNTSHSIHPYSKKIVIWLLLLCGIFGLLETATAASDSPYRNETPQLRNERMSWWRNARFGMFIHWGLYAVPAGEWNGQTNHAEWILTTAQIPVDQYEQFAPQFNPVHFDADQWVRMAKDAGMKYMVITSKHHDGFCLWDSDVTDYDVVDRTPFKRDILKELADACKKQGVTFCFYHSIMDWHHPDYLPRREWETRPAEGADYQRYIAYMKAQLEELVTRYDPAVLWFDGEWENTWTHEEGLKLYDYVRSLKPDIIINNRVDKGRRGMQGTFDQDEFAGDFGTPEQEIPATGLDYDWESCMTMNNHWGWNKHDKSFKSTEDLIHKLVDIASKGGNFLLNIGPKPDGTFPEESIERLEQIGRWMDVNGESIYGTTASPFERLTWGCCTKKANSSGTTLYLHVFTWPENGQLFVPGLKNKPNTASLLANVEPLTTTVDEQGIIVQVPAESPDTIDTVIVLDIPGELDVERILPTQNDQGIVILPAELADLHGGPALETKGGMQNIGFWTNTNASIQWSFTVRNKGTFTVNAEIAVEAENSNFEVIIDTHPMPAKVASTGGYEAFETMTLGSILLDKGEHMLQIKPIREQWQPINVRSITLEPKKQD